MQNRRRFNHIRAGRRWRKTTGVMSILVDAAIQRPNTYIWAAPTYDQARTGMDETRRALGHIAAFNESRMTATLPTGGQILYRSLDRPENLRGKTAGGVVIDEAAEAQPEGWYEVLRPMLIDTGGWAWFIYTPKGRNWVWQDWQRCAQRTDTALFHAPTLGAEITPNGLVRKPHPLENPNISFDELRNLYETMPERSFRQEILAEFIEDGGGVFRNVRGCIDAHPERHPIGGRRYAFGVDWGRSNDYTVIDVIDTTTNTQVAHDRFTDIGYQVQVNRLVALYERFKPQTILAESNSMGAPLIEQLQGLGLPVTGFHTDNASKKQIIEGLQLAFERNQIKIQNDETAISELEAYEQETLRSGLIRYSAPGGLHDDCFVAGTMILTNVGQVPIENIRVGDMVMTREGYRRVVATRNKLKPVITNHLLGLTGTPDHPIITPYGELSLAKARANDTIYVWNEKLSSIETRNITATLTHLAHTCAAITGGTLQTKLPHSLYTGKYGLMPTEKCHQGSTSTTKTGIHSITQSKTLKPLTLKSMEECTCLSQNDGLSLSNMGASTPQEYPQSFANGRARTQNLQPVYLGRMAESKREGLLPLLPIGEKKTQNWRESNTLETARLKKNAPCVICRNGETKTLSEHPNTQGLPLKKHSLESHRKQPVCSAERPLHTQERLEQSIALGTVATNTVELQRVFNLQVEDTPEYFANGILVHNCVMSLALAWHASHDSGQSFSFSYVS